MPKYTVTLCEERWYYAAVEVEAANEDEADKKALEIAEEAELDWEWTDGQSIEVISTELNEEEVSDAKA
jgi:hypothetical protein